VTALMIMMVSLGCDAAIDWAGERVGRTTNMHEMPATSLVLCRLPVTSLRNCEFVLAFKFLRWFNIFSAQFSTLFIPQITPFCRLGPKEGVGSRALMTAIFMIGTGQ
jgi:hypothetical protein